MNDISASLFNKPGYLPLSNYLAEIKAFKKSGQWKLPLGHADRFHLFLLSLILLLVISRILPLCPLTNLSNFVRQI